MESVGLLRKAKTLSDYACTGMGLGADLRSKWILASMLPGLKLGLVRILPQKRYKVAVRIGPLRQHLFIRPPDIFIVREVLAERPYIHPSMKDNPPRVILDLGAHIGLATLCFKAEFPDAEIHCYEPDPENFELLHLNTEGLHQVFLHQEAVGSERGEAVLYIPAGRHSASSLRRPLVVTHVHEVICKVKLLDDVLTEIGRPVDLIKFDIEGVEHDVFRASRLIHRVSWIVGEIKGNETYVQSFVSLFPRHYAEVRWRTPKMALVYLRRADDQQ